MLEFLLTAKWVGNKDVLTMGLESVVRIFETSQWACLGHPGDDECRNITSASLCLVCRPGDVAGSNRVEWLVGCSRIIKVSCVWGILVLWQATGVWVTHLLRLTLSQGLEGRRRNPRCKEKGHSEI